jgi:hypothetical protein
MHGFLTRSVIALGGAVALLAAGVVPAQAAGSAASAPVTVAGIAAEHGGPAATPASIRAAAEYLRKHPLQGRVSLVPKASMPAPAKSSTGALATRTGSASAWLNWWGVRVYLTSGDLRNLFFAITIYGFTSVAEALCAPGAFLAVACGLAGIVVGYIVADAVWNTWGYRGGCGLYVDIPWNLWWYTWGC